MILPPDTSVGLWVCGRWRFGPAMVTVEWNGARRRLGQLRNLCAYFTSWSLAWH